MESHRKKINDLSDSSPEGFFYTHRFYIADHVKLVWQMPDYIRDYDPQMYHKYHKYHKYPGHPDIVWQMPDDILL
jgi:hypothetical protein